MKRRGRRPGSRTHYETPAVKLAREFLTYKAAGLKPMAAAKRVAAESGNAEQTIMTNYTRHFLRLIEAGLPEDILPVALADAARFTVKAEAAADAAEERLRKAKIDMGRKFLIEQPEAAAKFERVFDAEFFHFLDRLAARVQAAGNPQAAQAVRAFNPRTPKIMDAWFELLGSVYVALIRAHEQGTRLRFI